MYIISGCLLGYNCKYDGGNNYNKDVKEFASSHSHCIVCPEEAGGLPTPRPPAEYVGDRILNNQGEDVTEAFLNGAKASLEKAMEEAKEKNEKIEGAILKGKSPSCGHGTIYDGHFDGTLIEGNGAFVKLLKENGIEVISEKEINNGKF